MDFLIGEGLQSVKSKSIKYFKFKKLIILPLSFEQKNKPRDFLGLTLSSEIVTLIFFLSIDKFKTQNVKLWLKIVKLYGIL